uniref:Claudin 18 n=1 Tax=Latimeria chalumnae TaxID=7897 RepID=H3A5I2_LATCH
MSVTMCQSVGFLLSVLGLAGIIAATGLDMWSTQDLYGNPVTAVFNYQGLWRTCVRESSGFTECRPYFTILGLPSIFQAVRALMIVGLVLGAVSALVSIFAMKCIRIGNMDNSAKAKLTLVSGIIFIVAGLCAIVGVSIFANMLVTNFWMSTASFGGGMGDGMGMGMGMGMNNNLQTRYTFGSALFVGWVGGGLAVAGGIMMCIACRGMMPEDTQYKGVSYHASARSVPYKAGLRSAPSYDMEMKNKTATSYDDDDYRKTNRSDDVKQSYPSKYDYV